MALNRTEQLPSEEFGALETPDATTLSELSNLYSSLTGKVLRPADAYSDVYTQIRLAVEAAAAHTAHAARAAPGTEATSSGTEAALSGNSFFYTYTVYILGPATLWLQIGISTELSSLYTNGFKDKKFLKGGFAVLIVVNCGGLIAYFTLASLSGAWIYLAHATIAALNLIWSIVVLVDLAKNLAFIGGIALGLLISYHLKLAITYELLTCAGCMSGYYVLAMIGIGRKFHINKQYLQNMRDAEEESTLIESLFEADDKPGPMGERKYDVQL